MAASAPTHDSGCHREGERLAQRVPDCEHPFTHAEVVGVAQRDARQAPGIDLDDGHVGVAVAADYFRLVRAAVEQRDVEPVEAVHHVVVGDYVSVR
jgi:hypothetical protein